MKIASFAACRHHLAVDLERRKRRRPLLRVIVAHRHPDIGHHTIRAARRLKRVLADLDRGALALAQASSAGEGANASGAAILSLQPNRAAACTQEVATLLASPIQAIVRPLMGPFSSSKVITSAITWQGCDRQVSPLITGTLACAASSSSVSCGPVRSMIAST